MLSSSCTRELDLHRITLGALIIALGLLVDDAIIAIEMMVVKMERAGIAPRRDLCLDIDGISDADRHAGHRRRISTRRLREVEFRRICGWNLLGGRPRADRVLDRCGDLHALSWTEAIAGLRKARRSRQTDAIYDTRIYRGLRHAIDFCLRWRKSVVAATVFVFFASIGAFGFVQQQFFPTSTRTELFLEMRLPEGSAMGATDATARQAERLIGDDHDVVTYTTYVGQGSPRFWIGLNPILPNANFAQIVIVTRDLEARERVKARLEKAIADGALSQARTRVDRFVFGPPVGFPVQFRVVGPNPLKVRAIAEDVRKVMAGNAKLVDPHLDWSEQFKSIRLEVDQDRARALGLTPQDVAQTLQTLFTGLTVTQYREGIENIDVVARAIPSERLELARMPSLTITTRNGIPVPLSQIAHVNYEYEEPILWRRNRDLVLTVRGDIVDGVQAPDVSNEIAPKLQPIKDALPYGYRIETGGSIEESAKANTALAAVFPVMIITMLALLMIQLQSFSRLALVIATAPLGLIGATGALLIASKPFGFVALLGLIALAGMIMRNTVILVDQIDHDIAAGHSRYQAILDATVRRARPVVLTALAAHSGHGAARPQHLLGPDGDHHYGRVACGYRADAAGRARALRALVPSAAERNGSAIRR